MVEGQTPNATQPAVAAPETPVAPPAAPVVAETPPAPPPEPKWTMQGYLKERLPEVADLPEEKLQQMGAAAILKYREMERQLQELQTRQAVPEPKPAPPESPWWEQKAEYDPSWRAHVELDPQTNLYKPLAGHSAEYADKLNRYEQRRQDLARKLLDTPADFLAPLIKHVMSQELRQQTVQQQHDEAARKFLQDNQSWIMTGPNPLTGQPSLTKAGEHFAHHLRQAEAAGVPTPIALKYAYGETAMAGLLPAKDPLAHLPPPTTPDALAEKRRQHELAEMANGRVAPANGQTLTAEQRLQRMAADMKPTETPLDYWARSQRPV